MYKGNKLNAFGSQGSLWFVLLMQLVFIHGALGQTLTKTPVAFKYDDHVELVRCGISSTGKLLFISSDGRVLMQHDDWLKPLHVILPNPLRIKQIFEHSNQLYYVRDHHIFKQSLEEHSKPIRLEKIGNDALLFFQHENLFCQIGLETFMLRDDQLITTEKTFPTQYSDRINLGRSKCLIQNSFVYWVSHDDQLIDRIQFDTTIDQIFKGKWEDVYILSNGQLYLLNIKETRKIPDQYPLGQVIEQVFSFRDNFYLLSNKHTLIKTDSNLNSMRPIARHHAFKQCYPSENILFCRTSDSLYRVSNDHVAFISLPTSVSAHQILDLHVQGNVLSLLHQNGLEQCRMQGEPSNWTWGRHIRNARIETFAFNGLIGFKDAMYGISPQFGIVEIGTKDLKRYPWKVSNNPAESYRFSDFGIIIRHVNGGISVYNDGTIQEVDHPWSKDWIWLDIENPQIVWDKNAIWEVESWTTLTTKMLKQSYILKSQHNIIDRSKISACTKHGIHESYLYDVNKSKRGPTIDTCVIRTNSGKTYTYSYPFDSIRTIEIGEDDWPIQVHASAVYKRKNIIKYSITTEKNPTFRFSPQQTFTAMDGSDAFYVVVQSGEQQSKTIELPISVRSTYWAETIPWHIIAGGLAVLLLSSVLYGRYVNFRNRRKLQVLENQNKLLELEQKALQLQMNPHFIFNAINGIKGMIALGEHGNARLYLSKLATVLRAMLNHTRAQSIAFEEEIKLLKMYMEIEQELHGDKWTFDFIIDPAIQSDVLIPPMFIQPFLENCIKHAFRGISYKGIILMRVQLQGRKLYVEIEDNGIGLDNKNVENAHKSIALDVIRERMKLLNQGTKFQPFELIDKKTLGETGVIVKLRIPIVNA